MEISPLILWYLKKKFYIYYKQRESANPFFTNFEFILHVRVLQLRINCSQIFVLKLLHSYINWHEVQYINFNQVHVDAYNIHVHVATCTSKLQL